jgi:hypothetical protein
LTQQPDVTEEEREGFAAYKRSLAAGGGAEAAGAGAGAGAGADGAGASAGSAAAQRDPAGAGASTKPPQSALAVPRHPGHSAHATLPAIVHSPGPPGRAVASVHVAPSPGIVVQVTKNGSFGVFRSFLLWLRLRSLNHGLALFPVASQLAASSRRHVVRTLLGSREQTSAVWSSAETGTSGQALTPGNPSAAENGDRHGAGGAGGAGEASGSGPARVGSRGADCWHSVVVNCPYWVVSRAVAGQCADAKATILSGVVIGDSAVC